MQVGEITTTNQIGKYGPLKGQCCIKPGSYIKGTYFLNIVKSMSAIKKVVVINLDKYGDPIYAGMEVTELITNSVKLYLQMQESNGHFYYADKMSVGDKRRKELAEKLFKLGIR